MKYKEHRLESLVEYFKNEGRVFQNLSELVEDLLRKSPDIILVGDSHIFLPENETQLEILTHLIKKGFIKSVGFEQIDSGKNSLLYSYNKGDVNIEDVMKPVRYISPFPSKREKMIVKSMLEISKCLQLTGIEHPLIWMDRGGPSRKEREKHMASVIEKQLKPCIDLMGFQHVRRNAVMKYIPDEYKVAAVTQIKYSLSNYLFPVHCFYMVKEKLGYPCPERFVYKGFKKSFETKNPTILTTPDYLFDYAIIYP